MEVEDIVALGSGALGDLSVLGGGSPLVVHVDTEPDPDLARAAAAVLRRAPTVTIVEGRPHSVPAILAEAADVCLTEVADAARPWAPATPDVAAAVGEQPLAATALAVLLRSASGLDVADALAAEAATYGMLLGSRAHRDWLDRRGPARDRPATGPPVAVERHDDTLVITLDRPAVRNAIDRATRDGLVEALAIAVADPAVAEVVLSGAGPCFSAGGDLDEFGSVDDGATAFAVRLARHPGRAVHEVADRTTARVHGTCVGAGVEVAAFAGRVVAAPGTTFRLPELAMGLVPGAGGTVSIARRIGRHRTAWMALTGATLDTATAVAWGLVDEVG